MISLPVMEPVSQLQTPGAIDALRVYLLTQNPPIEVTAAVLGSDGSGVIETRFANGGSAQYFGLPGLPRHDYRLDGSPVRRNAPKRLSDHIAAAVAAVLTDSAVAA